MKFLDDVLPGDAFDVHPVRGTPYTVDCRSRVFVLKDGELDPGATASVLDFVKGRPRTAKTAHDVARFLVSRHQSEKGGVS